VSVEINLAELLRKNFDDTFAHAPAVASPQAEMLVFSVGGSDRAVRLGQIASVSRNPGTVAIPARAEAFLGVAGMRGAVVPVFSLAELLGVPDTGSDWLLMVRGGTTQETIAFACEAIRGYVRVEEDKNRTAEVVKVGTEYYPVVDLHALRERLELATRSKNGNG
jgi:purine-binding chemotaxis protein CheW